MEADEKIDQFELLEEKIDSLIKLLGSMQKEKESLVEKVHIQDERIANMSGELESLKSARDKAKLRIISLLEKFEKLEI